MEILYEVNPRAWMPCPRELVKQLEMLKRDEKVEWMRATAKEFGIIGISTMYHQYPVMREDYDSDKYAKV